MSNRTACVITGVATIIAGTIATSALAQANPYNASLLHDARALAHAVPGDLPQTVGYLSPLGDSGLISDAIEGAPKTRAFQGTPVFQVRYAHGWIMVDASMDKQSVGKQKFDDAAWSQIDSGLRGAGLIVITHEHIDHVVPLLHDPLNAEAGPHTLLNRQQFETLLHKPNVAFTSLDSTHSHRFLVVDYDRLLPIGPGVVLIRTPGHTPGAQMVYVQTASGHEMILAGDVAWLIAGVDQQRQKPDSTSRKMSEDRTTIGQQLAWLKNTVAPAGVSIVISHDATQLQTLAKQGVLSEGLDLKR